jgi:endonuclease/exonuclease/phosphatase family metal-dependent hydrolase
MNYTILTYNIAHCIDFNRRNENPKPVDIQKTAKEIARWQADVVALNEVYTGEKEEFNNQTEKLANGANFPFCEFAQGCNFEWAQIGNSVLSKYPLTDIQKIPVLAPTEEERFPNETQWYEDRVILKATVGAEKPFDILATHFGLNGQEQTRMMQALLKILDNRTRPIVLLGDFNARPHTEILKPLYERLQSTADIMGNTDKTFPSWDSDRTIDYIFVSSEFKVLDYEVGKEIVSDHLPVKAVVEL